MYLKKSVLLSAALGVAIGISATGTAWAQDTQPAQSAKGANADGDTVDATELVVTARRRSERLVDVPVSVSVVSTKDINTLNITTAHNVGNIVSGLQAEAGGSSGSTRNSNFNFSIRGQSGETGVVTYVNEVPNYPDNIYDLSSIQVLKGPQGTLFGAVTTGGAILLQTQLPTDELQGFVDVRFSARNQADVEFGVGGPIIPGVLSMRLAGISHTGGSFTRNLYNGQRGDGQDNQALRLTLKLDVGRFEDVLMGTYGRNADQVRLNMPLVAMAKDASGKSLGIAGTIPASIAASAGISCATGCPTWVSVMQQEVAAQALRGHYTGSSNNFGQTPVTETLGIINKANLDLTDWLTIRDIFSFSKTDRTAAGQAEQDGFSLPVTEVLLPVGKGTRTYTNEIQLQAHPMQSMHITTGYFYQHNNQPDYQNLIVSQLGGYLAGGLVDVNYISQATKTSSTNKGLFGQVDWEVVPHLTLTGGVRKTWVESTNYASPNIFSGCTGVASVCGSVLSSGVDLSSPTNTLPTIMVQIPGMPSALALGETSYIAQASGSSFSADKVTYTLAADYKVSDNMSVYVTNRTGYRIGGYNKNAPVGYEQFGPENVTDWEAGIKARWGVGGLAGTFELAVYHDRYSDIQQQVNVIDISTGRGARVTQNAGTAIIKGFDLDVTARYKAFDLTSYFSLTDAHYTQWPNTGQFGSSPPYSTLDLTDQMLAHVSKYRWGLRPALHLSDMGLKQDVVLSANVYYKSKFTGQNSGILSPYAVLPGRTMADIRAEWRNVSDTGLTLAAGVLNVSDYNGLINVVDFTRTFGYAYGNYQQPRTWYAEARFSF